MKDHRPDTEDLAPLAAAEIAPVWRAALEDAAETRGYYDALGDDHVALFSDAGEVLLVSFEEAGAVRARPGRLPLGWDMTRESGASSLVLLSEGRSWFRAPQVWAFFDRLSDDGFFDAFERVIFLGAGPEGYAACAFSVAAPGATVLAIAPQATLAPAIAGWDRRFVQARRLDFTSRYGYAPDMLDAAASAFVVYDPARTEDAMHAMLFAAAGVPTLPVRLLGADVAAMLTSTGALGRLVAAAADGQLDRTLIAREARARRDWAPYLRSLLDRLETADRPRLTQALCRSVVARKRAPRFRKALEAAERELSTIQGQRSENATSLLSPKI